MNVNDPLFLNEDLTDRAIVYPSDYHWLPSAMPGVDRMRLDRICAGEDRVTTIVRYAPNSSFSSHIHDGGEEFFVLDGTFSDEHGDYPVGTYVRNPIGTAHTPRIGESGATIFVKLSQFKPEDDASVVIDSNQAQWHQGAEDGLMILPLHEFDTEWVSLMQWTPNTRFKPQHYDGGVEILVLAGCLYDEQGEYSAGSWLRLPQNSHQNPFTKREGAITYLKTGHLFV